MKQAGRSSRTGSSLSARGHLNPAPGPNGRVGRPDASRGSAGHTFQHPASAGRDEREALIRRARAWLRDQPHLGRAAEGHPLAHEPSRALASAVDLLLRVGEQTRQLLAEADAAPSRRAAGGLRSLDHSAATTLSIALMVVEGREAHRLDLGHAAARTARCAGEVLRCHTVAASPPWGTPVEDVPASLLILILELSIRLRATGREGHLGRRFDAGVAARDGADTLVTTYRRWRYRLPKGDGQAIAALAVSAAQATCWAGLATLTLSDDDGCGLPSRLPSGPPPMTAAAEASPPLDASYLCVGARGDGMLVTTSAG